MVLLVYLIPSFLTQDVAMESRPVMKSGSTTPSSQKASSLLVHTEENNTSPPASAPVTDTSPSVTDVSVSDSSVVTEKPEPRSLEDVLEEKVDENSKQDEESVFEEESRPSAKEADAKKNHDSDLVGNTPFGGVAVVKSPFLLEELKHKQARGATSHYKTWGEINTRSQIVSMSSRSSSLTSTSRTSDSVPEWKRQLLERRRSLSHPVHKAAPRRVEPQEPDSYSNLPQWKRELLAMRKAKADDKVSMWY